MVVMVQQPISRALLCLLGLLVCGSLSTTYSSNTKLTINRPRNGQVVSRRFSLSATLPQQADAEAIYDIHSNQSSVFGVSVVGVVLYQGRGHLYLFDSYMFIAKPDDGSVELTVFQADNSNKIISSSTVTVFVHDQDSHFVRAVEQTLSWVDPTIQDTSTSRNSPEYRPTQSSYLFVGLGTGIISRLSMLHPRRVTVLDLNTAACGVLGGVEIVHCVKPSRPLDLANSLYFDVAILSYTDMFSIWQNLPEGSRVTLGVLYDVIAQMTRRSVWILVPHADTIDASSEWNAHLQRVREKPQLVQLSREFFTNITLTEYTRLDKTEDLLNVTFEEVLHLHGIDVFVQSYHTPTDKRAAQKDRAIRLDVVMNEASAPVRTQSLVSTIVASNLTLGNVHVHIQNACILRDGSTVVVFSEPGGVGMSIWDKLTAVYAQDENNGFQFTPIRLKEVPLTIDSEDPTLQLTATAQYLLEQADWTAGLSAVPYSAWTGHIVHQIESLLQLLDCNHYIYSMRTYSHTNISDKEQAVRLARLLFPLLLSEKINDWLTTVISLILEYSAGKCYSADENPPTNIFSADINTTPSTSSRHSAAPRASAVHLRNHLFNTTAGDDSASYFSIIRFRPRAAHMPRGPFQEVPEPELQGSKCYNDLLLLGRTNTHVKFFPSPAIGKDFRDFVYERMQVKVRSYCDIFCSAERAAKRNSAEDPPLSCPPVSMECTMHIYREHCPCESAFIKSGGEEQENAVSYRKLRVTISIRTAGRRILNLPDLTEAMLATGLVHKEWLLSHILVLESLSFAEQVRIYAETDILICVHGAAAINGIFMRPGSVVFEIFNGRFVEFVFAPPLREVGVHYVYTYVRDHAAQTEGCDDVPPKCLQGSVYAAASIDCVRVRTCSVRVDVVDFELVFMQAYYHVLSHKWHAEDKLKPLSTEDKKSRTTLIEQTENANEDVRELRAAYLMHVKHQRFNEALDAALLLLPNIASSPWSPIYFLELGVIYFTLGDHLQAYQYCQRALQSADPAIWGGNIVIQVNACLGSAGAYLTDFSPHGEHVIQPFLTAWQLSTAMTTSSQHDKDGAPGGETQKDMRWGLCSTMMAAPLYSLEFNLLRSFERFGRNAECLNWYSSALHLPELQQGGAYIIAYAMVKWSESHRAHIDQLERQLRVNGELLLPAEVTLWDEIRRVQSDGQHTIAGASQCLNRYLTSAEVASDTHSAEEGTRVDKKHILLSMVSMIVQRPNNESTTEPNTESKVEHALQSTNSGDKCRLVLFTQFYMHPDPQKNLDLQEVLQRNLNNPFLSTVYLVNEREYDFSALNNSSKIVQFVSGKRLTFQNAFQLINQYESGSTVILANSDIYFDETLHLLARCSADDAKSSILGPDQAFALLKWTSDRADSAQNIRITLRTDTQDAWIFRAPMHSHVVQQADFYLGQPKCDNRMVALLQEVQYRVSNPAFSIHAIELHYETGTGMYANNEAVVGNVSDLLLSDEMYY